MNAAEFRARAAPGPLVNAAGLRVDLCAHGGLRRLQFGALTVNLFPGGETDPGPANLWLRLHEAGGSLQAIPLLGPHSPLQPLAGPSQALQRTWAGRCKGLLIRLQLRLAAAEAAWFWHVEIDNEDAQAHEVDLIALQDVGLSSYAAIRLNEHYVSHYIDLQPLQHGRVGTVLAARQNLAVQGRHPWCLMASLAGAVSYATDAWQWAGTALRAGHPAPGLTLGLAGRRLQHEHALMALQDARARLAPGQSLRRGFFGWLSADHPGASGPADAACVDAVLALPEASPAFDAGMAVEASADGVAKASLFGSAQLLEARDLQPEEIERFFPGRRRHEERDPQGRLLSFFRGDDAHVALRAKELLVQRPHGHILRSGRHLVPDETALTSTCWMAGVFHSMLTQGHVSINRCLGTVRSGLALFRGQGLRVFVRHGEGAWQQLGVPSAFEIEPEGCRWLYRHASGTIEVRSAAAHAPHAMRLRLWALEGPALAWRITLQIALGGEDEAPAGRVAWTAAADEIVVPVPPGSPLAARFEQGSLRVVPDGGLAGVAVRGDEALYADGSSRDEPYLVIDSEERRHFGLALHPALVTGPAPQPQPQPQPLPAPRLRMPNPGPAAAAVGRLAEIIPWYLHNALVHYLSPRGLEQYSGGGWGTRDVCQGPLEMLLALDQAGPARDLLCRVFAAQDAGGDWPQWFMFFERERHIRAGDAHGDIVFWPLLGLARYLLATQDASILDEDLPFYAAPGVAAESGTLWQHVERARGLIDARRLPGTGLVSYGHGDWNDSLQPADPALREHLCSSWTVTLHHQVLRLLAQGLRASGRAAQAAPLEEEAAALRGDFRRWLMPDGVICGYALFEPGAAAPRLLLHPRDTSTGVHASLLPIMHAVLEDLVDAREAQAHLQLIESRLLGPDGARLFDAPMPYHGGPQRLFQRAESSAFFGREIGLMYMHAHLRYAEMLAHLGEADRLFAALQRMHPILLQELVPGASPRQANCYYSSSDAAFDDRYEASAHYGRIAAGSVALDGGWRIYSSGPGIALSLLVGSFLGLRRAGEELCIDPVMPATLAGLQARVHIGGLELELHYQPGPRGHAPLALLTGTVAAPWVRMPHAYRKGGVRVPLDWLRAHATAGRLVMTISTS